MEMADYDDDSVQSDEHMAETEELVGNISASSHEKEEEFDIAELPDMDAALGDWFKVKNAEASVNSVPVLENSDTETEDDSDHEELRADDVDDEWQEIQPSSNTASDLGMDDVRQFLTLQSML